MTDRCLDSHCEHPDHRDSKLPDLTPAEEAEIIASAPGQIGPGQTPISRPPSTIAAAFEAMLAFLQMLIARKFSGLYTPAVRIGVEAAEQVDLTHWHAQQATLALRDLIQRAAEEHARGPAPPGLAEYEEHLAASMTPAQKASAEQWAEGAERVTDSDLAEIEARTSGPGPLAEDGALLRRCAAEIRRLTAKLAGIEGVAAQGDGMMATISEQAAEIARWTAPIDVDTEVESEAREVESRYVAICERLGNMSSSRWPYVVLPHVEREARLRREIERLTAELAGVRASYQARETEWREGRVVLDPSERPPADASLEARAEALGRAIIDKLGPLAPTPPRYFRDTCIDLVRAVDASRTALALDRELLGRIVREVWIEWAREQTAPKPSWLVPWEGLSEPDREVDRRIGERIAQEALASRPGLTEEEAIGAVRAEMGSAWIDANPVMAGVVVGLLRRHSRGALAPGDVSVPRAILERLAKAADPTFSDAREARWAAARILQRATLAAEPARTDPEAALATTRRQP